MRKLTILTVASAVLLVAGCGADEPAAERYDDPALGAALNEPIMIDPDLAGQNRANSAAAMPSQDGSLPTIDNSPEAIAVALDEALRLVGGSSKMKQAPPPREGSGTVRNPGTDCDGSAQETMLWAARMPPAFPVYPRAAVQQATGTDAGDCALRVVNFVTPVSLGDVMNFYFTRARAAGFSASRVLQDGADVLSGAKGDAIYAVYLRRLPSGTTEVDLVTNRGQGG